MTADLSEIERLQAENARLRELLVSGLGAVNAAYEQAQAEFNGHDRIAERHDQIIHAWRKEARAALKEKPAP